MNEITTMFENSQIRIVDKDDGIWFVAKDVSDYFGDKNYKRSFRSLDEDEKGVTRMNTPGGMQDVNIINESGLYRLLFNMHPEEARKVTPEYIKARREKINKFKRWVTHDVLPSIRRTGTYTVQQTAGNHINGANMQRLLDIMQNFSEIAHENARISERNCYLSQFEPRSEYGDPNDDGIPCYQKRRGYFVSRKGADVVKKNPEKETFEQLDLFYDRLPGILLKTFKQTLNELTEGK